MITILLNELTLLRVGIDKESLLRDVKMVINIMTMTEGVYNH